MEVAPLHRDSGPASRVETCHTPPPGSFVDCLWGVVFGFVKLRGPPKWLRFACWCLSKPSLKGVPSTWSPNLTDLSADVPRKLQGSMCLA